MKTTRSTLKTILSCSLLALMSGLAMAQPTITLGPTTIVPIPANPVFYYANDSRFPYLPNSNGTANITFWVDGVNFRSQGASLDTMNPIGPSTSVLSATAGTFDNGGVWLVDAIRRSGTLYGFYHAEDHSCVPYTEWNTTGLATSMDDGVTWVKQGQIVGNPNPCTGNGGIGAISIAWDTLNSRWIGWGGRNCFVSTSANAAAGTWYGYYNGSFSTPMPGSGPLTALSSLSGNLSVQSVAWNSYLGQWVMVYHQWGDNTHIYYTTSSDGIAWAAQMTLLTVGAGQFLNYSQIIGDTGETCGQDALLVYESSPSTQTGRSRDMIERWIHWGSLTTPSAPTNLTANGQWSCQAQVVLKWNAAAQAQGYNIFRSTSSGGTYTKIADIATSASFPTYTDLSVAAGAIYYYEVQATNTAGASAYSSIVSVAASDAAAGNTISINIVGGTTGVTNTLMDCSEVAGVVAAPTWNNAVGASGTLANLQYDAGASSGASVIWSSPNTWSTGISDTPGNYRMMKGYLDGSSSSVTISNIPTTFTNAGYDVYVYCDGDSYSGRIGKYSIDSTSIQATDNTTFSGIFVQAINSAGNYVVFSNLKMSQFTLSCQGVGGGDGVLRAPVNGIQINSRQTSPPPPVPTGLTATAASANQINLSWTASSGATSYNVKRATVSGGPYTTVATGVTTTSYSDTGLSASTTYYYVVSAMNSGGESANSTQASATTLSPPPAPTGLTATAVSSSQINLSWTTSTGATSYNVKRATVSGGPYTTIATGVTAKSYSDTGLAASTIYYYVVSAVNTGGESANSTQASATTLAGGSVPPAPTGLTATAGNAQVSLSWTASSGATSYNVKRATVSGGPYTAVATGVTATSYVNTGLVNGTVYYYVVSAVNAVGESPNSSQVSATPSAGSLPPAPTGLTGTLTGNDTDVQLDWTAVSGASSYKVKRATVNGGPYTVTATPTANSYLDNSAKTQGATYYYVVSAVNATGEGPNSAQVSVVP